MSVPHIPGMTDEELIVYAMREAQLVLARHIERSPQDAEETIALLLETLVRTSLTRPSACAAAMGCGRYVDFALGALLG